MTTEIQHYQPAGVATVDQLAAVGQLMQHAQAMQTAMQLAEAMCQTDMVPAIYKGKPGNGAAAILYGAELGLNPIQSLQQIFVVHGAPAIYARTMIALVKSRGYLIETVSSADDAVTVRGTDPRTSVVEESTWTLARATKAGYTTNKKYSSDPQAMLYAKAATEVCRKIAPEVLLGIAYSREELELEPVKVESKRIHRPARGVAGVAAALAPEPVVEPDEPGPVGPVMASREQQAAMALVLDGEKLDTKAAKLGYLQAQFGDHITSAADVTAEQADQLIAFLTAEQAKDQEAGA